MGYLVESSGHVFSKKIRDHLTLIQDRLNSRPICWEQSLLWKRYSNDWNL